MLKDTNFLWIEHKIIKVIVKKLAILISFIWACKVHTDFTVWMIIIDPKFGGNQPLNLGTCPRVQGHLPLNSGTPISLNPVTDILRSNVETFLPISATFVLNMPFTTIPDCLRWII